MVSILHPNELFQKLFAFYGPQDWWPGEGFEIAIGAILTQNTSWVNVEKALENLRQVNLLNPEAIMNIDNLELEDLIRPAGFFKQKSIYLKNMSKLLAYNPTPSRGELLAVKGIGEETADSILLYLFEQPEFVIDSYTVRISQRLGFGSSNKKNFWKQFYESKLEKEAALFNEFHALLVIHAKNYCLKRAPKCNICFLMNDCKYDKK